MSEQRKPKAGEWWVSNDGTKIGYVCGFDSGGDPVAEYSCGDYDDYDAYEMATFLTHWHHEPRCTGFDWVEPPSIDPGEGYYVLPVGTMLEQGDECHFGTTWVLTGNAGDRAKHNIYRRKIKPAEVWPKWYRWNSDCDMTFRVREHQQYAGYRGRVQVSDGLWNDDCQVAVDRGEIIEITEAEAMARLKPRSKIRLFWHDGDVIARYDVEGWTAYGLLEIHSDGTGGWYVEE